MDIEVVGCAFERAFRRRDRSLELVHLDIISREVVTVGMAVFLHENHIRRLRDRLAVDFDLHGSLKAFFLNFVVRHCPVSRRIIHGDLL
jgi:hypothetical protein